jgi:small-conductance mechanosensitive channel/CRP-like cAMP-binding protein
VLYSYDLILGAAAALLALAARAFTSNRLIRNKLRLSLVSFVLSLGLAAAVALGSSSPERAASLQIVAHVGRLLLALGGITLIVVLAINPWRVDRTPEHFPNIVQDALIIAIFLVVATAVMQEKFLTTSAVGAVVIGFALQDTLGNMFAGLAIQIEKPFSAGHWIKVGAHEGRVSAITWRATRLRTKSGDAVILPNNVISKEAITNYSAPAAPTLLVVDVGASYAAPPTEVKAAVAEALSDASLVLQTPAPETVIVDFAPSAITYRIKFWVDDYGTDDTARDQVRTGVYYAFRRRGIQIPYPIQVQFHRDAEAAEATSPGDRAGYLAAVELFRPLAGEERADLAAVSRERLYGAGQTVVREGEAGDSLFVVATGRVRVTSGEGRAEVATIAEGGYFGEMSLLTGAPRSATVSAVTDCLLLEIGAGDLRRIALAHPAVVDEIGQVVAARRLGLEQSRQGAAVSGEREEAPRRFLARVRQFLNL